MRRENCIRTFTGKNIDVFSPVVIDIDIYDIARGLACMPIFSGQTCTFYSLAQHSVERLLEARRRIGHKITPSFEMATLLNDARKAYIHDIPWAIKYRLPGYENLEHLLQTVIYNKFSVYPSEDDMASIELFDDAIVYHELNGLVMGDSMKHLAHWHEKAEREFLHYFKEIEQKMLNA